MSRADDAVMHLQMARNAERQGDFLGARVGYMKCTESWKQDGNEAQLESATKEYEEFVKRDPIFRKLINGLLPFIKANPGVIQSEITGKLEAAPGWSALYSHDRGIFKDDVYYALYFAEKLGMISRAKKGRSYELRVLSEIVS